MPRPKPKEDLVSVPCRLPASLRDDLYRAADERDVSVNLLVVKAVRDYLTRLPVIP